MASYNGAAYIKDQLDSILGQLDEADEIVISDDGSSDGTLEIIKEYQTAYNNVHLISGPHDGVIKNFENALRQARGDIVFLCDQDDIWKPNKVQMVLGGMRRSGANLIVHNAEIVDADLRSTGRDVFGWRGSRTGFIKNILKNSFMGCCMTFDREVLERVLPFPEGIAMHDWWIGLVSSCEFRVEFIEESLLLYRRHTANVSGLRHKPAISMFRDRVEIIRALHRRKVKLLK